MYIKPSHTYYRGTEQYASRSAFLILFSGREKSPNGKPRLYAAVRKVALHQCGHWMMGSARIAGVRIPISGSCGADGLPRDYDELPDAVRQRLTIVPEDVAAVYWADDGHNTIGKAAPDLRSWALEAFTRYRVGYRGKRRRFTTLAAAKAFCEQVHTRHGWILGIESEI